MSRFTEAQIYVGTYQKYNEGSIKGKWLQLANYRNISEFYVAARKLHSDEKEPELMFQDYEYIPEGLAGECFLKAEFFTLRDAIEQEKFDEDKIEALAIYVGHGGSGWNDDDLLEEFNEKYHGKFAKEEDFALEFLEGDERIANLGELANYFDYDAYSRDLFLSSYWSKDGHVFSN